MRLRLWCVWTSWIFSLHAAAQHPPDREEGGVQPGWRSSPTPLDVRKPATVRGAGGKVGGRRAALNGPHVCGARCCVGWTLSPKTRRCTKPRCLPRCHNNALCRQSNRCVCRRGFHGYRCEVSTVSFPPSGHPLTSARPTRPEPKPAATTETSRPEPGSSALQTSTPGSSGPDPFGHVGVKMDIGANELFEMQEQNRASTKRTGEPLRPRRGQPKDAMVGQSPKSKSDPEPKTASGSQTQEGPHVDSGSWSKTDGNGLLDPKESLIRQTEDGSTRSRSKEEESAGPGPEDGLNPESGPGLGRQKSGDDLTGEKKTLSSTGPGGQRSLDVTGEKKKKQTLSLREAQAVLLRKTQGGKGDKMAALLMKHIEKEKKKLLTVTSSSNSSSSPTPSSSVKSSVRTFHTQKGQYTVHFNEPTAPADGQTAVANAAGGGGAGGGGGVDRIQVMFTPTICKMRCSQERCVKHCERGNMTTLYSSNEGDAAARRDVSHGPGFRVFLCPLLCKNGGVCLQKDRCLCPPNFTGKFCQIPVAANAVAAAAPPSSTNEIVKPALLSTNQELTQSEFLLPLGLDQEAARSGGGGPNMVKVRVQHPPEASVKIHQVLKVSGFSPTLRTLSSTSSSGSAGAPAPGGGPVQAQTLRGDGTFNQQAGFKYCFREVKDGQCSSPLPGLRSREMCCRGLGKAWGITDCVLCPDTGQNNSSCPVGFERSSGGQCVDVNECLLPGMCENGICVNTRGSYSCVCRVGFILDASHGICISQSVISEEKSQCYRVLGSGQGPSSCSLPILRNITKQICCCSRVGKAWGPDCQRCPYFGSVAFKEICPAGPGYHYSASALQFNQRVTEQLGNRGASLVPHGNQDNQGAGTSSSSGASRSQEKPSSSGATAVGASTSGAGSAGTHTRPSPPQTQPRPQPQPLPRPQPQPRPQPPSQPRPQPRPQPPSRPDSPSSRPVHPGSTGTAVTTQQNQIDLAPSHPRPQPPSTGTQAGGRSSPVRPRPDPPPARGDTLPSPAQPQTPERGSRPSSGALPPVQSRPAVSPTTRVQTVRGVCETRPGVCGRGRCVDQPGGRHTCVCDQGYQPNTQRTYCQDVNECLQSPGVCPVGECVNSMGSYRCVCPSGYRSSSQQTGCQDIDECQQNPCSNGRCDNTPGSYRCVCRLGYRLSGNTCTDVDECEDPLQCPGQECINSQGSYRCVTCQPGYRLSNRLCTDIDECRQAPCTNGRCENTPGSYRCACHHGYKLQNNICTDVDECAEPSQCPGQKCVNTVGSYRCMSCRPGYTLVNRQCADVNECEDREVCRGQRCVNTEGSYSCVDCEQGHHSVNGVCTDIDECASAGACEAERVCVNTVGSFRCDCRPGYRAPSPGRQCRDINECLEGDFCFPRGECVNTAGSYTCVCAQGFKLSNNKTACLDVDECMKPGVCVDGRCVNTEGSFHCQCQTGFTTNPERTACLDVDECVSSGGSVCSSQRCENTIGSYRCLTSCEPGFQVSSTGSCADVDECSNSTVCGEHATCQNLFGTYLCACHQGFTSTADEKACEDEDECVSLPGVCGSARCENVEGSFMCECDRRGDEFDPSIRRCVNTARRGERVHSSFSTSSSNTSPLNTGVGGSPPILPPLPAARPVELRECYYNLAERGTCSLLATNTSQQECCCTVGEGWGLGCQYHTCPAIDTAEFLSLCPSGRGYVTTGPGAFSYRDVDECKRFHPEVCKNGVCVNNIPGYNCYCSSGYVYDSKLLECVDEDECVSLPGVCGSARCENVEGSFMCECDRRGDEFDPSIRRCVNTARRGERVHSSSSSSSTSSSHTGAGGSPPILPPLPAARPGELRECYYNLAERGTCSLLATNTSQQECCCTVGEGWGLGCQYHTCPATDTAEFLSLCPSGRGYVTTGPGAFSYRDVDECKRFHPEVCKNGVCVNNIPGYNCYCSSGYVYNSTLLECVDHDECEEESCVGGVCVNTVGSYYCSCQHPLVLDGTQRNCVNSSRLTEDENLSICWQHVNADLVCQSPLVGPRVTYMDCCCLYGEGWAIDCALCPPTDSDDYATLCSSFLSPLYPETFPDSSGPEPGVRPASGRGGGGGGLPYFPPYSPDSFPPAGGPSRDFGGSDYDDYSPAGDDRSGFRGRGPVTFSLPDGAYRRPEYSTGYYSEDFTSPDGSPPRPPPFRLPADPRAERAFGARPPPPSRPEGAPLSLAPLPGGPYLDPEEEEEEEEVAFRPGPPFPPFTERSRGGGGGAPRRVYERRYESYGGEDCGILYGCENGRCIRVAEGFTCDCYQGYGLDMTSMTCIDKNECEDGDGVEYPCVNARCVNTEGSFRCVCRRGYVMSRRPNHCVAA